MTPPAGLPDSVRRGWVTVPPPQATSPRRRPHCAAAAAAPRRVYVPVGPAASKAAERTQVK